MTANQSLFLLFALAGCAAGSRPSSGDTVAAAVDTVPAAPVPSPSTPAPLRATATVEDSILDGMLPGRKATTPAGDTLEDLGGGMIDEKYAVSQYRKNGDGYFRIQQITGNMADGKAIWRFITRVSLGKFALPYQLMFAGQCGVKDTPDSNVIAIARFVPEDEVFTVISRAWRFDPATETVREIPTADIRCFNPGGD